MMAEPEDELSHALEIARIGGRYRFWPGSGQVTTPYDHPMQPAGNFVDWGLARAVAIILNAVIDGKLVVASPPLSEAPTG